MLGKRLREEREKAALTQEDLGKIVNVSDKTISAYENDAADPSTETLSKLADCLGLSTDYLLGRTNVRNYSDDYQSAARPVEHADIMVESIRRLVEEQAERVIRERGLEAPDKPKK